METKNVSMAILGIVAVIGVVGLVMMFTGNTTANVIQPAIYPSEKLYGGGKGQPYEENSPGRAGLPYAGGWVAGTPYTTAAGQAYGETKQQKVVIGGKQSIERVPSLYTTCPAGLNRADAGELRAMSDEQFSQCQFFEELNTWCCPPPTLN